MQKDRIRSLLSRTIILMCSNWRPTWQRNPRKKKVNKNMMRKKKKVLRRRILLKLKISKIRRKEDQIIIYMDSGISLINLGKD